MIKNDFYGTKRRYNYFIIITSGMAAAFISYEHELLPVANIHSQNRSGCIEKEPSSNSVRLTDLTCSS